MKEALMADGLCIKIYNPLEQKLVAVFDSYNKAANKLGVTRKTIVYHAQSKTRILSPILNIVVAVRLAKKSEEDINLITITNKRGRL
jgi:uncharacterized membrane protein